MKEIGIQSEAYGPLCSPSTSKSLNRVSFADSKPDSSAQQEHPQSKNHSMPKAGPTITAAKLMNPVLNSVIAPSDQKASSNLSQKAAQFLLEESRYEDFKAFGDQKPPMLVAGDKYAEVQADEFQIYNDYVRRMSERHQMIIESAKRERIQASLTLKAQGVDDIVLEDQHASQLPQLKTSTVVPPSQDILLAREARDARDQLLFQQEINGGPKIIGSMNQQLTNQNGRNSYQSDGLKDQLSQISNLNNKEAMNYSYLKELQPMVYPNKYMHTPIKSEATTRYCSGTNEVFESKYGKQIQQVSLERDVPLQVDYQRLKKVLPSQCDCTVTNQELERTAQDIIQREERTQFEKSALDTQISVKPHLKYRKDSVTYADEYTPLHYDRQVRDHDADKDYFLKSELANGSIKNAEITDNISEPILKKKRQVSFNFDNGLKIQSDAANSYENKPRSS